MHKSGSFVIKISKSKQKQKRDRGRSDISFQSVLCVIIGVYVGFSYATWVSTSLLNCDPTLENCCSRHQVNTNQDEASNKTTDTNVSGGADGITVFKDVKPKENLVFIGIMTAQKYLDSRAKAVFDTWAPHIPGKISFFTSEGSKSIYPIPIVALPGVDDTYPPQKKSFLMFKFMHDNYLDKFEWFMRVDDDVYLKPERITQFLRSLNSTIRQFIGQPGTGTKDEFGLLSLDYGENFCMGGPGIIMSKATLQLLVPHIRYCLKNLYSTHEDVEIGRCVRRFAGIPCTWSYEMQHLFYHNASGTDSFTNDLLVKEVFRPISLHPIKQPKYLYRVHNFFNIQKILELKQKKLNKERDAFYQNFYLQTSKKIAQVTKREAQVSQIFNRQPDYDRVNRFKFQPTYSAIHTPKKRQDEFIYEYYTRSIFSPVNEALKRGLEGYWKRSLNECMRQMDLELNKKSKERGRIWDFQKILYGYMRHHPLVGLDYIIHGYFIDREYIGKRIAEPVRMHVYLRQTYTDMIFREDTDFNSIYHNHGVNLTNYSPLENSQVLNETLEMGLFDSLKNIFYPFQHKQHDTRKELHRVDPLKSIKDMPVNNSEHLLDSITDLGNTDLPPLNDFSIDPKINDKIVHFVVPLIGRFEPFKRFIKNFENVCLRTNENVEIAVVLFWNRDEDVANNYEVRAIMENLRKKYSHDHLHLIETDRNFSRSIGREIGVGFFQEDALICFLDVDVIFTRDFLLRIRLHTIQNKQVYFPVVYSEFDPNPDILQQVYKQNRTFDGNHFNLHIERGYWRQVGFGNIGTYKSDFLKIGGFDTSIFGWGKEDVDIYAKYSVSRDMIVYRAIDPGLVHVHHLIRCDLEYLPDDQMIMCVGTKMNTLASKNELARIVHKTRLFQVEKNFTTNHLNSSVVSTKSSATAITPVTKKN